MPKLEFAIPGLSASSVYTCGKVTNGPPSIGQCFINGKSEMFISSYKTGLLIGFFFGNAVRAAGKIPKDFIGCFKADAGSIFISISCFTTGKVCLKINWLLSKVPKIFDAARNLEPFTFSNKIAGPFCS